MMIACIQSTVLVDGVSDSTDFIFSICKPIAFENVQK